MLRHAFDQQNFRRGFGFVLSTETFMKLVEVFVVFVFGTIFAAIPKVCRPICVARGPGSGSGGCIERKMIRYSELRLNQWHWAKAPV
jgi:hypothetical protein